MSRERGAELGDFTANRRLLVLIPMALLVGGMAALVAAALVRLIDIVTSLASYQRFASVPASPADHQLGWAAVLVPMIGGLVIGLMARFGSDRIRDPDHRSRVARLGHRDGHGQQPGRSVQRIAERNVQERTDRDKPRRGHRVAQ